MIKHSAYTGLYDVFNLKGLFNVEKTGAVTTSRNKIIIYVNMNLNDFVFLP